MLYANTFSIAINVVFYRYCGRFRLTPESKFF